MTKLVEEMISNKISEVSVQTTPHGTTRMRSDKESEAKAVAERHMRALSEALEELGLQFSVNIESNCANVNWGPY